MHSKQMIFSILQKLHPIVLPLILLFGTWYFIQLHTVIYAFTFIVNTVSDASDVNPGDGLCETAVNNNVCTLRAAIEEANSSLGADIIAFNIEGPGPYTIVPNSALPIITDPVTIDGTTQPNANCSTWPPTLLIQIDGYNTGTSENGLTILAGTSVIKGLVINNFHGNGIILKNGGRNTVQCNFLGTDPTGSNAFGNTLHGLQIDNSANNRIGGTAAIERNLISTNPDGGIFITNPSSTGNVIQGNYIGSDVTGLIALGTLGDNAHGVEILNASNNTIGGMLSEEGNLIAFNDGNGVRISGESSGNLVLSNLMKNGGLEIDLGADGVTVNDEGDIDSGANHLQNFPFLISTIEHESGLTIKGTLNSQPNTSFILQFYAHSNCNSSNYGRGEILLGSTSVTTNANGNVSYSIVFPTMLFPESYISATATDSNNNTSEYSPCFPFPHNPIPFSKSYFPIVWNSRSRLGFPIFISPEIPSQPVTIQGETFYSTTIQMPDSLPLTGRFYLSSTRTQIQPIVVDDAFVILIGSETRLLHEFSIENGNVESAIVEIPRDTMEQLIGNVITVEYRDIYGSLKSASEIWMIWSP